MRRGLTIAELLTVLLIIAILAGLLFPVLRQARVRAAQTSCESNLRQIYLAIELYHQDWGEYPGLAFDDPHWTKTYMGGAKLRCPRALQFDTGAHYFIKAGPVLDAAWNSSSKTYNELLEDCRRKREGDFVMAYDTNHVSKVDGYEGVGRRLLLVRANGSVQNVELNPKRGPWMPCDPRLGLPMQH